VDGEGWSRSSDDRSRTLRGSVRFWRNATPPEFALTSENKENDDRHQEASKAPAERPTRER
jgi:hypothetical protein